MFTDSLLSAFCCLQFAVCSLLSLLPVARICLASPHSCLASGLPFPGLCTLSSSRSLHRLCPCLCPCLALSRCLPCLASAFIITLLFSLSLPLLCLCISFRCPLPLPCLARLCRRLCLFSAWPCLILACKKLYLFAAHNLFCKPYY